MPPPIATPQLPFPHGPSPRTTCSGAASPANGTCTSTVGSSPGNSVKCPACTLAFFKSAAMTSDEDTVPGWMYAVVCAGRADASSPLLPPGDEGDGVACDAFLGGAGDVMRIRPLRMTVNLGVAGIKLVASFL